MYNIMNATSTVHTIHVQYIQYNIIIQSSTTAINATESLDVDSIPVTKLDLGISLVIG